jgi:Fic family protein
LTHPLRWSDSKVERVQSLVLDKVDSLLRCPAELNEVATHEALSKLRPHVETELEALETLEWLRDLTDEELARQRAFMTFLSVAKHDEGANKPVRERILAALRLEAATYPELQKLTGAGAGTIRNNLSELINEGKVVADGGRPKTYRLVSSVFSDTPWE